MKAPRWWMRVPRLVPQLLIAALGVLALSVVLGLLFGGPLFAVAPVGWLTILFFGWLHYRSGSKIQAWEHAKREAETLEAMQREALEAREFEREVAELERKNRLG